MGTEVKNIELFNNSTQSVMVCKGRLICGSVGRFGKLMDVEELRGKLRPIIITENEEPKSEDNIIIPTVINGVIDWDKGYEISVAKSDYAVSPYVIKVIVQPENFSSSQIEDIVNQKFNNLDEVLVKCELEPEAIFIGKHVISRRHTIVELNNGYASFYKVDVSGWDSVKEDLYVGDRTQDDYVDSIIDILKEKGYNVPTKK